MFLLSGYNYSSVSVPQIHLLELFKAAYIRFSRNSLAVPKSFKSLTIQFMQFYFGWGGRERKDMQLLTVWLKFCSKHNGVKDPMKWLDSSVGILTIETVEVGNIDGFIPCMLFKS